MSSIIPTLTRQSIVPSLLTTERLILRQWQESDGEPFARLNADRQVREFFPSCLTRDESDAHVRGIHQSIEERGWGFWAVEKLTLEEIVAFTVPLNERSIAVMKRIGMTRDPADDFDHPNVEPGHPLQRHVLYRMKRSDWDRLYVFRDAPVT